MARRSSKMLYSFHLLIMMQFCQGDLTHNVITYRYSPLTSSVSLGTIERYVYIKSRTSGH